MTLRHSATFCITGSFNPTFCIAYSFDPPTFCTTCSCYPAKFCITYSCDPATFCIKCSFDPSTFCIIYSCDPATFCITCSFDPETLGITCSFDLPVAEMNTSADNGGISIPAIDAFPNGSNKTMATPEAGDDGRCHRAGSSSSNNEVRRQPQNFAGWAARHQILR